MGLKVHRYNEIIQNLILFLILSLFFLHIIISFSKGLSALNLASLKELFLEMPFLNVLFLGSLLSIMKAKEFSKVFLILFFFHISAYGFLLFFENFDKIILVLNFIYIIFSFYFYICWTFELRKAIYLPCYTPYDIGDKTYYDLKGKVSLADGNKELLGFIVNWDKEGCFFYSKEKFPKKKKGYLTLQIEYEGLAFFQRAEIVTSYFNGVGLRFVSNSKEVASIYSWNDFFKIIGDRGFLPLRLRK